ncbi:MAG: C40 family peptidase [Chlorobi bacterium]|nr:C40 family peptidase [Chlorobiota bacterium]
MSNYGIIIQSLAPLRKEPAHRSEMISQIFFGEPVVIEQQVMHWYRVKVLYDGNSGWLEEKYFSIAGATDQPGPLPENILSQRAVAKPGGNDTPPLQLYEGTRLIKWEKQDQTFFVNGKKWILDGGKVNPFPVRQIRETIIRVARSFIGVPYLWGGISSAGFDETGLVQTVFRIAGVAMARDISTQAESGMDIHFLHDVLPGDLAFFSNGKEEDISHTGIITAHHEIIHASGGVRMDTLDPQGIYNHETRLYSHTLRIIKRMIHDT